MQSAYKDYIWGGYNLHKIGKKVPDNKIAESWELSMIQDSESRIANGALIGLKFSDIVNKHGQLILGSTDKSKLPLIKFIDANNKLSVQVHPDDKYALENECKRNGKTEMWYVIDAKPNATVIHGFAKGHKESELRCSILDHKYEGVYREVPVKKGDVVFVAPGTVHALNDGIVVVEIQQHSDVTYRIFDYERKDSSGKKRPLHVKKALDILDFNVHKPLYDGLIIQHDTNMAKYLAVCNHFCVKLIESKGVPFEFIAEGRFSIFTFLNGEAEIESSHDNLQVDSWETVFIPAYMGRYRIIGKFTALQIFLPDEINDISEFLKNTGFSDEDIAANIAGFDGYLT